MTQTNEPRGPSGANRSRAMLIAVALMLAAIAVAADIVWMMPH
jgi:hypothetical protein